MWDRAGQLGESGEYWTGRLRVVCFHILGFEGGSLRLCRLRTDRLAPVNKVDYVLAHTGFMESHKLSSFDGYWVGRHPTVLHGWYLNSVRDTHGLPVEIFMWKMALGYGSHSCCLCGSRVSCCQVVTLQGYIDLNLHDTLRYGWCLFAAVIA
jgi:hypothetical protein